MTNSEMIAVRFSPEMVKKIDRKSRNKKYRGNKSEVIRDAVSEFLAKGIIKKKKELINMVEINWDALDEYWEKQYREDYLQE